MLMKVFLFLRHVDSSRIQLYQVGKLRKNRKIHSMTLYLAVWNFLFLNLVSKNCINKSLNFRFLVHFVKQQELLYISRSASSSSTSIEHHCHVIIICLPDLLWSVLRGYQPLQTSPNLPGQYHRQVPRQEEA